MPTASCASVSAVGYGELAAPHAVAGIEGGAVAVVIARVALLGAQARSHRRRWRGVPIGLAVQRCARRAIAAVQLAHEGVLQVKAIVRDPVRFREA